MPNAILIVDDSPIARKILKQCLPPGHGYALHEAADGAAAVAMFRELRPDITFLDLTMPVMDGLEALKAIRQIDAKAVVIIATADVQGQTLFRVMESGALMLIRKPLQKESVQEAFRKAVEAQPRSPDSAG